MEDFFDFEIFSRFYTGPEVTFIAFSFFFIQL